MSANPYESPLPGKSADPWVVIRGLGGAVLGGVIGYWVFYALYKAGLYGIMIPGALLGIGAGLAARGKSMPLGVICALAAIALGIYSEWTIGPFAVDNSLWFFITHVHNLPLIKLILMGVGAACAYWFGQGR